MKDSCTRVWIEGREDRQANGRLVFTTTTAWSGFLWIQPQNYAQQGRESLKNDTKVPDINIKREYLTPFVQKYLSKFLAGNL
jgi:hypothetical protein